MADKRGIAIRTLESVDTPRPRWSVEVGDHTMFFGWNEKIERERTRLRGHYCGLDVVKISWETGFTNVKFDVEDRPDVYEYSRMIFVSRGRPKFGTAQRVDCGCEIFVHQRNVVTFGPFKVGTVIYHTTSIARQNGRLGAHDISICMESKPEPESDYGLQSTGSGYLL